MSVKTQASHAADRKTRKRSFFEAIICQTHVLGLCLAI